jgi:hypothetical protein
MNCINCDFFFTLTVFFTSQDNRHLLLCIQNLTLLSHCPECPCVKTALGLVDISFSIVDRTFAYNAEVPRSNPIGDITFFGDKICSTVTHSYKQDIFIHVSVCVGRGLHALICPGSL